MRWANNFEKIKLFIVFRLYIRNKEYIFVYTKTAIMPQTIKNTIMNYSVKITNEELYNEKVVDVDLDFHKGGMNGDVAIEVEGQGEKCFTGEHGTHDYENEYGFIIVAE